MTGSVFLGSGMKFPPQINPATGRFAVSSGPASVKESIYIILMTHKGERWLEPSFGSGLMRYVFMDLSPTMINICCMQIRADILEQEPRVSDVEVSLEPTPRDGCLLIRIGYTLIAANTRDNMVFPFYINGAEETPTDG